eukprot:1184279-Prorocentrum_minimum.AAC.2
MTPPGASRLAAPGRAHKHYPGKRKSERLCSTYDAPPSTPLTDDTLSSCGTALVPSAHARAIGPGD